VTQPVFHLPKRLRRVFAWPRGLVVKGDFTGLLDEDPIVCVGDVVSQYCSRVQSLHIVLVVDGKTRRVESVDAPGYEGFERATAWNPPGTLSFHAYTLLCRLLREPGRWLVEVEGEEDMVALAGLACSPGKGTLVYGVPGVGAAVIRVTPGVVREAQSRILMLRPGLA